MTPEFPIIQEFPQVPTVLEYHARPECPVSLVFHLDQAVPARGFLGILLEVEKP
jgi:hypothetical protein